MTNKWGPQSMKIRFFFQWFHTYLCIIKDVNSLRQMKQQVNWVQTGSLFFFFSPSVFIFLRVLSLRVTWPAYAEAHFHFQGCLVISVWSLWHVASYHPLGANKKRRRCMLALDSESLLVHSTQITKLAGSGLGLDRRAEEADLICLLTDGSPITHSHPPASHVGME